MTAYDDLIVARSPRLYLPLHTNALSAVGPNPTTTDFVGGQEFTSGPEAFGQATRFRLADTEELRINDTTLNFGATAHTIECWFKRSGNIATVQTLYRWNSRGTTLKVTAAGLLRASWFNSGGTETAVTRGDVVLTDGFWHHVAVMFTGSGLDYYTFIDGKSAGSHGTATPNFLSSQASIGSSLTTEFLDAELCGVAVYPTAKYLDATAVDATEGAEALAMVTYYAGLADLGVSYDTAPTRVRVAVREEERTGRVPIASRTANPVFEPAVAVTPTLLDVGSGDSLEKLLPVDHNTFFGVTPGATSMTVYVFTIDGGGVVSVANTISLPLSTISTALGGATISHIYRDCMWWNDRFWIRVHIGGGSAEPVLAGYDWNGTTLTFYNAFRPVQGDPTPHMRSGGGGTTLLPLDDEWAILVGYNSSSGATAMALSAMLFQHHEGATPTMDGFGPFTLTNDASRVNPFGVIDSVLMADGNVVVSTPMYRQTSGLLAAGQQWITVDPVVGTPTVTVLHRNRRPPETYVNAVSVGAFRQAVDLGDGRCLTMHSDGRTDWNFEDQDPEGVLSIYNPTDGTFDLPPRVLRRGASAGMFAGLVPEHPSALVVLANMVLADPDFDSPWEEGTIGYLMVSFDDNGYMHEWHEYEDVFPGDRLDWSFYAGGTAQLSDFRTVTFVTSDFNGYNDTLNAFFVVDSA